METLPEELIREIINLLDSITLKKARFINSAWNTLSLSRIRRDFRLFFKGPDSLNLFLKDFEPYNVENVLHFKNLYLCKRALWSRSSAKHLYAFGVRYGSRIISCELDARRTAEPRFCFDIDQRAKKAFKTNLQYILNCFDNLQELTLALSKYELAGVTLSLPVFANLRTIHMKYSQKRELDSVEKIPCIGILCQIANQAPNLSLVKLSHASVRRIVRILEAIATLNSNVLIEFVDLVVDISEDSQSLAVLSSMHLPKVASLNFRIVNSVKERSTLRELLEHISNWISNTKETLRSIKMTFSELSESFELDQYFITLPKLPQLQRIKLGSIPFRPTVNQVFQFPNLVELKVDHPSFNVTGFFGAVFENVRVAKISLKNKQEFENWPRIVPNVEDLKVTGGNSWLRGIFNFTKLRKLLIDFEEWEEEIGDIWDILTAGVDRIANENVCSMSLGPYESVPSQKSFKNLQRLAHLEFRDEPNDCWMALIYASRTGQLRRLQRLVFSNDTQENMNEYRDTLDKFHNWVDMYEYDIHDRGSDDGSYYCDESRYEPDSDDSDEEDY